VQEGSLYTYKYIYSRFILPCIEFKIVDSCWTVLITSGGKTLCELYLCSYASVNRRNH